MKFSKLIILSLLAVIVLSKDFSSDKYFELSADEKLHRLWDEIIKDRTSAKWYGPDEASAIMTEDLSVTYLERGDVLPEKRIKVIHTVGAVARAEFIPSLEKHPYSGMFKSGNKNVLIRLSVAIEPDTSKKTAEGALGNFVPSIALKFLIDGQPSENLVALWRASGQPSWNYFKNDMSPEFEIDDETDEIGKAINDRFAGVTSLISTIGLKQLGEINDKGVAEWEVNFPYRLIFKPNEELRKKFSDNFERNFMEQIVEIPAGYNIYDVYATERPDCNEVKIGTIRLLSELTPSKFGDLELFFHHPFPGQDLKHHSDWLEYRDEWGTSGKKAGKKVVTKDCPYKKAKKWLGL
jgi:hypothetical protein